MRLPTLKTQIFYIDSLQSELELKELSIYEADIVRDKVLKFLDEKDEKKRVPLHLDLVITACSFTVIDEELKNDFINVKTDKSMLSNEALSVAYEIYGKSQNIGLTKEEIAKKEELKTNSSEVVDDKKNLSKAGKNKNSSLN